MLLVLQDNYSCQSFERGIAAQESGAFSWEIVPVRTHLILVILSFSSVWFFLF